jgi:hypothetical protein
MKAVVADRPGIVPTLWETAEKVWAQIARPVSPQQISFDDVAEALKTDVRTSRFSDDRMTAGGIGFFSGLVECERVSPAAQQHNSDRSPLAREVTRV